MADNVKFYMQKIDTQGNAIPDTLKDLEVDFVGLRYSKSEGLNTKGERKNIYTESYTDSDVLRVWQGDTVARKETTIKFTFYFFGEDRYKTKADFYDYIKNGRILYFDTKRNLQALLILKDELKPSEEKWYGDKPYLTYEITFQNLWGESINRNYRNLLLNSSEVLNNNIYLLGSYNLGDIKPVDGETVTLSFSGYLGNKHERFSIYNSGSSVITGIVLFENYNRDKQRFEATFKWKVKHTGASGTTHTASNTFINIYQANKAGNRLDEGVYYDEERTGSMVYDIQLEIGDKPTEYKST